jgi:hypothetical protein
MPQVTYPNFHEFAGERKCPYIIIRGGTSPRTGDLIEGTFFEDGSYWGNGSHAFPPTHRPHLLYVQSLYHKACLDRAEKDFRRMRSALMGEGASFQWPECYGNPHTDPAVNLRWLQSLVFKHREALAKIDAEVLATDPEEVERRRRQKALEDWREQEKRQNLERMERIRNEVSSIFI